MAKKNTDTSQDQPSEQAQNELVEQLQLLQQQVGELTEALQRERADATNIRNRAQEEKSQLRSYVKIQVIEELLPVIDNLELALAHEPAEIADHKWVKGVTQIARQLEAKFGDVGITRITAAPGTVFNPEHHDAVSMDDGEGEHEVIAEELRSGWMVEGTVVRPAMVKVTRSKE
jgi:molecular chaperone GrpE